MKFVLAVLLLSSLLVLGCLEDVPAASPTPSGSVIGEASSSPVADGEVFSPSPSPTPEAIAADAVDILYSSFSPESIRVSIGATVTWTNQDGRLHSVRSREGAPESFYSGTIGGKQTFKKTFNVPGVYAYYDDLTNVAQGTVYVG